MRAEFHSYDSGSPQLCVTTKGYMYAEVGASATIFGQNCGPKTKEIYNEYNSPIRGVYHYEDGKLVTSCARGLDLKYTTSPWSRYFNPYYGQGSYGDTAEPIIIWEYKVEDDGNATITKFRGNASAVAIPETIDGYTVTKIGEDAFADKSSLRTISMPNTIKTIDNNSFSNCENLSNVTLSKSLQNIGYMAFNQCISLKEINLPKTLSKCYYGENLDFFEIGPFHNSGIINATFEEGITKIPEYVFLGCENLQSVYIPDTVIDIGAYSFKGCKNLADFQIPPYLTTIGCRVLDGCVNVKEIIIPNSLKSCSYAENLDFFEMGPFCNSGITNALFEDNITKIPNYIFLGCDSLETVYIPDTVINIGEYSFKGCKNLSSCKLPPYLTTLGFGAFSNCSALTEIAIPKSLTLLTGNNDGRYRYFSNSGLKTINFEKGTVKVLSYLFNGANNLKDVNWVDTITEIGNNSFNGCTSLESITIPSTVKKIGDNAFAYIYLVN